MTKEVLDKKMANLIVDRTLSKLMDQMIFAEEKRSEDLSPLIIEVIKEKQKKLKDNVKFLNNSIYKQSGMKV